MAFNAKGFKTITFIGTPDAAAGAGTNRQFHGYVTNDDAAAVETGGYFDSYATRLKVGDIIMVSLDIAGTPGLRFYVVATITAGVVALTPSEATAIV